MNSPNSKAFKDECAIDAAIQYQKEKSKLMPAELAALSVGLAQVLRGEEPMPNVASMCVLALARLTGRHDWTEVGSPSQ